jgi:hypothetical protein
MNAGREGCGGDYLSRRPPLDPSPLGGTFLASEIPSARTAKT